MNFSTKNVTRFFIIETNGLSLPQNLPRSSSISLPDHPGDYQALDSSAEGCKPLDFLLLVILTVVERLDWAPTGGLGSMVVKCLTVSKDCFQCQNLEHCMF